MNITQREFPVFLQNTILFFLAILTCSPQSGIAQVKADLRQADLFYQQQGYHAAAVLYEQSDADTKALERLANSYRLIHDTGNAEIQYAKLVEQSDNPIHRLHYAQMLHSNGRLELAKKYYLAYDAALSDGHDQRASRMVQAIDLLSAAKNTEVVFENAAELNSDKSDFSPVFGENGVVFVSTRPAIATKNRQVTMSDNWTGDDYSTLYKAEFQADGTLGAPVLFSTGLDTKFHEGPLTFTKNGQRLLYTRNVSASKTGESFLKIATAVKSGKRWLRDDLLDLGAGNYNDVHPTISANGQQLIFASDRPGGYGGMDLYTTTFSHGHWGTPINLGPTINTAGNEVFPFLYEDGTLYFASDGWGGFGGLDIFHSQLDLEEDWEQAANLGSPFNSPKDDFGYLLDMTGTEGYLSSAREGGVGKDDLYHFVLPAPQSNKLTHFPNTSLCVTDLSSGQSVAGASVTVFTKNNLGEYQGYEDQKLVKWVVNDKGGFTREALPVDPFAPTEPLNGALVTAPNGTVKLHLSPAASYLIQVRRAGYDEALHLFENEEEPPCIALKPASGSYLQGRVVDKLSGELLAGVELTLLNLTTQEQKTGRTDSAGKYQFYVENSCDFIVKATKSDYGEDHALVSTFQLNGQSGVAYCDLQLQAEKTRGGEFATPTEPGYLIELDQIYYDYGHADIRPDAARELDQIALFLKRNQQLSIELRSHTDSRGDAGYNKTLSQQRALAAANYLIAKGIDRERVTALGKGEDQLLNDCVDGKDCTEEEHQINRRTEVRFYEK